MLQSNTIHGIHEKYYTVKQLNSASPTSTPPPKQGPKPEWPNDNYASMLFLSIQTPQERQPLNRGHTSSVKGVALIEEFHCMYVYNKNREDIL